MLWPMMVVAAVAQATAAPAVRERPLVELVETYRAGDRERALAELARRDQASVELEVAQLAGRHAKDPDWTATRRAATTMLAESALHDVASSRFGRARWQLLSAARLVDTAPPTTGRDAFELRFRVFAGLALHAAGDLETAHDILRQGLRVDPRDPELLTALGAVVETVATLRQYDRPLPGPRPRRYAAEAGGRGVLPNVSLADAEARYEQAVAVDPGMAEARLRLGRVRLLRGRTREALRDLEKVAAEAEQPGRRYLARLFEGRARAALGDAAGAAAAYRAAEAEVPQGQTAALALGGALDGLGDGVGAQEALDRASRPGGAEDPWLDYQSGQPARLDELLEGLRRLVP
jgi:tetratricopeptide (TPR) repeat protein